MTIKDNPEGQTQYCDHDAAVKTARLYENHAEPDIKDLAACYFDSQAKNKELEHDVKGYLGTIVSLQMVNTELKAQLAELREKARASLDSRIVGWESKEDATLQECLGEG